MPIARYNCRTQRRVQPESTAGDYKRRLQAAITSGKYQGHLWLPHATAVSNCRQSTTHGFHANDRPRQGTQSAATAKEPCRSLFRSQTGPFINSSASPQANDRARRSASIYSAEKFRVAVQSGVPASSDTLRPIGVLFDHFDLHCGCTECKHASPRHGSGRVATPKPERPR